MKFKVCFRYILIDSVTEDNWVASVTCFGKMSANALPRVGERVYLCTDWVDPSKRFSIDDSDDDLEVVAVNHMVREGGMLEHEVWLGDRYYDIDNMDTDDKKDNAMAAYERVRQKVIPMLRRQGFKEFKWNKLP
ncbi:MAG: hypothetical protein A2836_03530 [Candidatus Taylorbacteria bacterium RIFCSPHIGHO2_01_FULL_45_63]|uniref:Uncharacterized protein n=1 Tax=Candidatus Taylorbacteria bacterium RIFCSPHIGHO2_02_FULL_45_35 TaxID=1802311 RepID=A0A1G2MQ77_9BACT|nr:MAG: hypothetical protein A2836_03530 [Candidatus Taylorbacteria bacterium RIFCSPHIGHO2_01_FULL_45_63]OHA26037.1 MAG: hypothetical protein A3D56_02870 [Candidatus Taylorbacteria bacterium RIFCSPHIGHO2_02_FULL_45_35]OHA32466.1 MAG: hypothetical protein A3A22_01535 [Candidatus Taylorbacteria bacterium RIFCSPLOWO2_01_FULL_45_34b]